MRPYLATQSAREQRRSEQRRQRRRAAPHRARPVEPALVWADRMLRQIEEIAARLHLDGTLEIDAEGDPVVRDPNGKEWAAGPAIAGVVEVFDQWRIRHGAALDLDPLRELAARLHDGGTITLSTLDRVTSVLSRLRGIAMRITPSEAASLSRGTLIQHHLET